MTVYQEILEGIEDMGFGELVVDSFEVAESNTRKRNIVLIENEEGNGLCDVYLTYKHNGVLGEFVCWVEDEFEAEPDLVDIILNAIHEFYSYTDEKLDNDLIPNERLVPGWNSYN